MTLPRSDHRRILLIRRKALGDALVCLPAVTAVAEAWPRARIDLVIDRPLADLFCELATNVTVLAYPHVAGDSWYPWLRRQHYDLVVDWLGSPRTALWTALSGAGVRVGYDLPGRRWAYNLRVPRNRTGSHALRGFAGEAFLDPLRALGLEPLPWAAGQGLQRPAPEGPVDSAFRRWLREWDARPAGSGAVVLVMSATWSAKAWPARHVAGLWLQLSAAGVRAVLAPGPGDAPLVGELATLLPAEAFAPPSSLAEMAALLRRADLFVGTDNGLRHLATLLGLPTVTVFGPTDPAGWNPPGPRHVAMRTGEACSPCDLTICPVAGRPCLENLGPGPVAAAALALLAARGAAGPPGSATGHEHGKAPHC
ncbi:MAG: glycosyltransferase family 9 protein [bacterium]|nr:glycosyltransferase family 9 protein [bacterium]